MTLIVGIKCSDGVVIGADGAATLGPTIGQPTVIQPVTKLQVLQGRIIMGVSGQVGLSQLYCDRVDSLWKEKKLGYSISLPGVQRSLHQAIVQDAQPAIAGATASVPLMGNNALAIAMTQSLIAIPVGGPSGSPELIQCNHLGMAEAATNDLSLCCDWKRSRIGRPFSGISASDILG